MEQYKPILQPQEIPERFKEAWNRYDPDGIANLFFDKADFVNVTGKWWDNKKDIWKAHDFGLRVIFQHSKMEVLKVKVKMLSEDIAIVHARIRCPRSIEKGVVQVFLLLLGFWIGKDEEEKVGYKLKNISDVKRSNKCHR